MVKISPSILAADFGSLANEVQKIEKAGADYIHLDVMDGHFVPNISFGIPVVKSLRSKSSLPFDVHLMIEKPENYIDEFIKAGADMVTVHQEACKHLHRTIQQIKQSGCKAGVSLNPATNIDTLEYIISDIDLVLIMTVNPGFGGQKFIESMVEKVRKTKELIIRKGVSAQISIDGGVDTSNARTLVEAGADILIAGTAVFGQADYKLAISALRA